MLRMLRKHTNTRKKLIVGLTALGLVAGAFVVPRIVEAATYQQQIDQLDTQNSQVQGNLDQLGTEAASLKDSIAKLNAEIASLQAQITANETKRDETVRKIAEAETELARQKTTLGDNLKKLYVSGQMSTLEELASSNDLAQFADSEQYNLSVQRQIQQTLARIKQLQAQLSTEKTNLERMIAELQQMRTRVSSQQAEVSRLLALNQSQQDELDSKIKANSSEISRLRTLQAAENNHLNSPGSTPTGVPGGGGYPGVWAFAPIDSKLDTWGMYNRECVSYTAWKVSNSGRTMPGWGWASRGNAKQWDDNARAAGMRVTSTPSPETVAVSNAGTWGHVMWVEAVAGDGSIYVSDYNQQSDGNYREYWISAGIVADRGLVFVHF